MRIPGQRADCVTAIQQLGDESAGNVSSCAGNEDEHLGIGHNGYSMELRIRTVKNTGARGESAGEAGKDEFVEGPHGVPI